jgi:hypothetical protein
MLEMVLLLLLLLLLHSYLSWWWQLLWLLLLRLLVGALASSLGPPHSLVCDHIVGHLRWHVGRLVHKGMPACTL